MTDDLRKAVEAVLPSVRADLDALIRIPSISADPGSAEVMRQSAETVANLFRAVGSPDVQILDDLEGGQPAVVAHYPAPPGQPTIVLYAHHDVQPTGDPDGWTSPPFEPTVRGGRLYGRGSSDDKAGIAVHLAALRAFDGKPPIGVTVFIEGEEEIGSPTLGPFLERHKDKIAGDVIVIADSGNYDVGIPTLTTSLRGLVDVYVEVRTLNHGVHSGQYGGAAPDALTALARILATLHDEDGNVAIEGLVTAKTPEVEYPEDRFRAESALADGVQLIGSGTLAERLWAKPTASVLALDTTRVADASNTLIPVARAKVSVRLAPGDDALRARKILAEHLANHAPWGAQVTVREGDAGEPFALEASGPAYDAMRAAFREGFGVDSVEMGMGGSIPFIAAYSANFPNAEILCVSAGADPDTRAHGLDESLLLADFEKAAISEALLLAKLAR
ncbi:dipeptidase [Tenggerimyces flavus]|uniref:Dipeptidase n=1 Tax=Tenggerimyces flavus TaxID=1708749 RepID=A0ABV7YGA4_9ACTN|nr:dipeptidase [Tenggerimyces flavus]MBM7783982.1 acetylornithine deacetylase/succinyl-diaminopimelate desuccinylase-like protein [Tenggerimyces flavus]